MPKKSSPIAKAWVQLAPTLDGAEKSIQRQLGGVGAPAGKTAGLGFAGAMKKAVGPLAAIGLGAAAFDLGKDSIAAASDLGESVNAVNVVFRENAEEINNLGEAASRSLGLSNTDFNSLAVQFSSFVSTVAGDGGDVVDTLDDLTTRAADFASVMNLDPAEAAGLFQSGLAGESEPLRRFGLDLSAAAVDAYAYANGIAEVGEKLTEAEKVQARYGLLMEQTNQTAGDFANTSDSLANQQRILAAEWENLQAELGEKFLPVAQSVTGWLLDEAMPAVSGFIDDLGDPTTTVGSIAESLGSIWDNVSPHLGDALETGGDWAAALLDGLAGGVDIALAGGDLMGYLIDKGEELSAWGDFGGNAGQQFVAAFDGVLTDYGNEGLPGVVEGWFDGVGILLNQTNPLLGQSSLGGTTTASDIINDRFRFAEEYLSRGKNDVVPSVTAPSLAELNQRSDGSWSPITAPGGANVTVNIGTVNATDTADIVKKSQDAARNNTWTGSRGIDPRLTR